MNIKWYVLLAAALLVVLAVPSASQASGKNTTSLAAAASATHPPLPPGMTEEMYKAMMTPAGPKHPAGMPAGVEPIVGCIPAMGYHYANPKNLPFGPIYGWYNGKLTFTEIMVDAKYFQKGISWDDQLKPLPGYAINHVDFWYEPHGHVGYTIPHWDIHAWYVPHSEHMSYCNKSGKLPPFISPGPHYTNPHEMGN